MVRSRMKAVKPRRRRSHWKLLGLAGIAGVAATGAVVVHNRRTQSDLQPDELRERLHERLEAVGAIPSPESEPSA